MKTLELFCGENQSFSKCAERLGYEPVTLDWRCEATIQEDIRNWDYRTFPADTFAFVWASPPCDQISQLRNKTGDTSGADDIARATMETCDYFRAGGARVYVENPISALPRRPLMAPYRDLLKKVTYCSYSSPGDEFHYRKLTAIYDWSGSAWQPRPLCQRDCQGCPHGKHIVWARHGHGAVRRAECDASGLKSNFTTAELHRVPQELCREILTARG